VNNSSSSGSVAAAVTSRITADQFISKVSDTFNAEDRAAAKNDKAQSACDNDDDIQNDQKNGPDVGPGTKALLFQLISETTNVTGSKRVQVL